jgi:hypothetical protein
VRQASAKKWRSATALHDGVLQTLETLRRNADLVDPALRDDVTERASWLRRHLETGRGDQGADLGFDLDAVVTAARQAGIADAGSRLESAGGWLKLAPVHCVELWLPGPEQAGTPR